ncbi:hypothetical protein [Metallibacterium sp.]|jgi:hypothetical protein|uniref:hypothetical protein n=1 Tax=Metallibacterium sp. TaxID=2940281 RepID=UPI00263566DF|nr:hypothetical protein [Metallibacterium sp.]
MGEEVIEVWQCVGCGRIEAPQTCIGVCRDRKLRVVDADAFDAMRAERDAAQACIARYAVVLRQIASSTPRADACARHWRALQAQARAVLAD